VRIHYTAAIAVRVSVFVLIAAVLLVRRSLPVHIVLSGVGCARPPAQQLHNGCLVHAQRRVGVIVIHIVANSAQTAAGVHEALNALDHVSQFAGLCGQ
jgi:hypothetical protein